MLELLQSHYEEIFNIMYNIMYRVVSPATNQTSVWSRTEGENLIDPSARRVLMYGVAYYMYLCFSVTLFDGVPCILGIF